jgi:hypothetical protein
MAFIDIARVFSPTISADSFHVILPSPPTLKAPPALASSMPMIALTTSSSWTSWNSSSTPSRIGMNAEVFQLREM